MGAVRRCQSGVPNLVATEEGARRDKGQGWLSDLGEGDVFEDPGRSGLVLGPHRGTVSVWFGNLTGQGGGRRLRKNLGKCWVLAVVGAAVGLSAADVREVGGVRLQGAGLRERPVSPDRQWSGEEVQLSQRRRGSARCGGESAHVSSSSCRRRDRAVHVQHPPGEAA